MNNKERILVIGAKGQLGSELTIGLKNIYGDDNVIASDIAVPSGLEDGIYEQLDIMDAQRIAEIIRNYKITQIYALAAILSAVGEKKPIFAWNLNMQGLLNVLELAKEHQLTKVYWPSSIAAFGPTTPFDYTPQTTIMEPETVYGISKLSGELWCKYYFDKYGLDVRSLRYPGLISYKTLPGGGTTDYAIDIYHKAIEEVPYECFLSENSYLPMMYMEDAVKATLQLMESSAEQIKIRTSYNVGAMSFSPKEVATEIKNHYPDFSISYKPDFRQAIADSWPNSLDDTQARKDWNWKEQYGLKEMTSDMIMNIKKMKQEEQSNIV